MPRMELPHAVINLQQNEVGERAGQGVRADGTKKKVYQRPRDEIRVTSRQRAGIRFGLMTKIIKALQNGAAKHISIPFQQTSWVLFGGAEHYRKEKTAINQNIAFIKGI